MSVALFFERSLLFLSRYITKEICQVFRGSHVRRRRLSKFGERSACPRTADNALNVFGDFCRCDRFGAHGEECAEKENGCAPKLSLAETFAINPSGECERGGGTEKLERLGERDADLSDCYVIEDVCEGNAAHRGNDKNEVNVRSRVNRCVDFAKGESKRKKQHRSDEANQTKTTDRP